MASVPKDTSVGDANMASDLKHDAASASMVETSGLDEGKGKEVTGNYMQDITDEYPAVGRKKLLWKMDLRIVPVLSCLYILSYVDRANIGNAKIEGMVKDLGLTDIQYQTVLAIFFVTYIAFEIPSNWILERYFRTKPSLWIGIITVLWGVLMTLHGVAKDYGGIISVRILMGVFEAGLFPGAIAYLSKWYTKYELATRLAIFYVASALAGAFSGLLAFAIAKMDGAAGLEGWRWIFIIEGIATVAFGLITPLILADTPDRRPRWMSEADADYLIRRMIVQNGGDKADSAGKHVNMAVLWEVVTDWQYYFMVLVNWAQVVPNYGLKFTLPTILTNMGFTASNAQLLSIPPYVAGAISAVVFNMLSDKFRKKTWFLLMPQACIVAAYAILTPLAPRIKDNIGACFFAVMLANIGCYPVNPAAASWLSNNTAGAVKRSIGIAYYISISNIGGIFSSYMFIESEKPGYPTGFGLSLAFGVLGILATLFLSWNYARINKKRDRMSIEEISEKYTEEQLANLGDRSPMFRYLR